MLPESKCPPRAGGEAPLAPIRGGIPVHWKSRSAIAAAALLLTVPVGVAQWSAYGSYEPSSSYDTSSFMFQTAPQTPGKRVYFNAYTMTYEGTATGYTVNPNVAALRTRNEAPASEFHEAVLGVWTDCNLDGYIGLGEGAVREYHAALLPANSPCTPVTGTPNGYPAATKPHNYNGYVTELIPIVRDASVRDVRRYANESVMVWGDFNRPDDLPKGSCTLAPQTRGTFQSTGGVLNFVDCRVDVLGAFNTAVGAVGDPAGLAFTDASDARSGPLGQVGTFGSEDTQYSPANAWDCSGGSESFLFRSGDVINDTPLAGVEEGQEEDVRDTIWSIHNVGVYPVSTNPVGNTQNPTVPALVNSTSEGASGDCDTSNDRGDDFYGARCVLYCVGEADFNGVDANNKREADWNFGPTGASRGGAPVSVAPGGAGNGGMDESNYGLSLGGPAGARWTSDSVWLSKPGPSLVKADLGGGVDLADAYYLSFYAYIPPVLTDLGLQLPGGTGKYGSAQCGLSTSGINRGWNCDANEWYVNPDGTRIDDEDGTLARVGKTYNLRDVDCYDGSNDLGLGLGAAFYGADPCA